MYQKKSFRKTYLLQDLVSWPKTKTNQSIYIYHSLGKLFSLIIAFFTSMDNNIL